MGIKVVNKFSEAFEEVEARSKAFISAVMAGAAARSRDMAPIAYSDLVNSQVMSVTVNGTKVTGSLGYLVDYAKYLEGTPEKPASWKPKPPPKYGYKGKPPAHAWNPNARPAFLRLAFESSEAQREIEQLKAIFKF